MISHIMLGSCKNIIQHFDHGLVLPSSKNKKYHDNSKYHKRLTKYEVGAKPNPPKNPRRSPKNGKVTPMNSVNAAMFLSRT